MRLLPFCVLCLSAVVMATDDTDSLQEEDISQLGLGEANSPSVPLLKNLNRNRRRQPQSQYTGEVLQNGRNFVSRTRGGEELDHSSILASYLGKNAQVLNVKSANARSPSAHPNQDVTRSSRHRSSTRSSSNSRNNEQSRLYRRLNRKHKSRRPRPTNYYDYEPLDFSQHARAVNYHSPQPNNLGNFGNFGTADLMNFYAQAGLGTGLPDSYNPWGLIQQYLGTDAGRLATFGPNRNKKIVPKTKLNKPVINVDELRPTSDELLHIPGSTSEKSGESFQISIEDVHASDPTSVDVPTTEKSNSGAFLILPNVQPVSTLEPESIFNSLNDLPQSKSSLKNYVNNPEAFYVIPLTKALMTQLLEDQPLVPNKNLFKVDTIRATK